MFLRLEAALRGGKAFRKAVNPIDFKRMLNINLIIGWK